MMRQIAQQVANEYDRHPNDLTKKRYSKLTNIHEMKQEFVKRCYEKNISNKTIANFLGHKAKTISNLYRKANGGITPKYKKIIQHIKRHGSVTSDDFDALEGQIAYIRSKGYHVYRDGNEFKLA